jgi:alkanesulfonate monooxygenase SsuD/methylene tetrahydromethanopterin reductase-like flavin-dependent oxidoreductase (luciferase family)
VGIWLRYDLRTSPGGPSNAELAAVAIEQAAWADRHAFERVLFPEHHGVDEGYNPSPFLLAAAMAAVTNRIRLMCGAVLLPLHDPLRVAEDLAVLDTISNGRAEACIAVGYVQAEFEMFGRSLDDRAALVDEGLAAIRLAFTGKPFTYRGRRARVTPRPVQQPGPPLYVGGAVRASALRAARLGDGYYPGIHRADYVELYESECRRLGRTPGPVIDFGGPLFVHVTDDPERAWATIAPHVVLESNEKTRWNRAAGVTSVYGQDEDEVTIRSSTKYRVVTPDECVVLAHELDAAGQHLVMTPLVTGLDPEIGWASLQLFADAVLPRLSVTPGRAAAAPAGSARSSVRAGGR